MRFKKPFRAVPIRLGPYARREARRQEIRAALRRLGIGVAVGGMLGVASVAVDAGGRQWLAETFRPLTEVLRRERANRPVSSAYWPSCDEARAAGVTPIQRGEPGFRTDLDADGDGVACEAYTADGSGQRRLRRRFSI